MEFKKNNENELLSIDEHQSKPTKNKIFLGILFFVICTLIFVWYTFKLSNDIADLENNTKNIELYPIVYLLYQIGGKYLAISAPIVLIGCCFWVLSKGIQRILKKDYEK
jgi:hypothetical protein